MLWSELARCRKAAGEFVEAGVALDRALALYDEQAQPLLSARALMGFLAGGSMPGELQALRPRMDRLIEALGDEDSPELCSLLAQRSGADYSPTGAGAARAARAVEMAARLQLSGAAYPAGIRIRPAAVLERQGEFHAAAALFEAAQRDFVAAGIFSTVPLNRGGVNLAFAGEIDAVAVTLSELVRYTRQYRRRSGEWRATAQLAQVAWRRGRRAEYLELIAEVPTGVSFYTGLITASVALAEGAPAEALRPRRSGCCPAWIIPMHAARSRSYTLFAAVSCARKASGHPRSGRSLRRWMPAACGI